MVEYAISDDNTPPDATDKTIEVPKTKEESMACIHTIASFLENVLPSKVLKY